MTATARDRSVQIAGASVAGSALLVVALVAAHLSSGSQLALAQAADSLQDVLAGGLVAWAARTGARRADDDHPHGHRAAEPIAALVVAVLAGVLAVEVARSAIAALWNGVTTTIDLPVAAVFAAKVLLKGAIVLVAGRSSGGPALEAVRVDARNDVGVGLVALGGYALALVGAPRIDALLALLVTVYVGLSGLRLARDNVMLLMGSSAPDARRDALGAIAAGVAGVRRVDELVAVWHGAALQVFVSIAVDDGLSVAHAHALAHAVEARLVEEPDVDRAVVHVGPVSATHEGSRAP